MTTDLAQLCWPAARLGEALVELSRRGRLLTRGVESPNIGGPSRLDHEQALTTWIRNAAMRLGIEAEPAETNYAEVRQFLLKAGPAVVRLATAKGPVFLALVRARRETVNILGPDLRVQKVSLDLIVESISAGIEPRASANVQRVLELEPLSHLTRFERNSIRRGLLTDQIGSTSIDSFWLLRLSPGTPFISQIRQFGLFKPLGVLLTVYSAQYCLGILAWWILGAAVLAGHFDLGWLMAWALLLLTMLPLQALTTWYQGVFAIGGGGLLKRRLLFGALQLQPEELRSQGAGQLLGRVVESEAVESLALNAGLMGALAVIELVLAAVVMPLRAGGWFQLLLLICWIAGSLWLGWISFRRRDKWTGARISMTHDLVEKMVGHRTRLVQERRDRWHSGEDCALEDYFTTSRAMDRAQVWINAIVYQGWIVVGVLGLAPAFIAGRASQASLAIGLGATLLASGALQKLSASFSSIAGAAIAWLQVAPLFRAAGRSPVAGHAEFASPAAASPDGTRPPVLEANNVVFRHKNRAGAVLNSVNLCIQHGDRIMLEGPSGGGKSTFAALLAGLRSPELGTVLMRGVDQNTLGFESWRKLVALAPQFNENHVLAGSLAFNLLMGRRWPPKAEDLAEAERVCCELGLAELLNRMPAGLFQMVGENGWQLSHGERSRVFIARALLQHADLIIFDESLGSLDPQTLLVALRCISQRANAVLLIAHP